MAAASLDVNFKEAVEVLIPSQISFFLVFVKSLRKVNAFSVIGMLR